MFEPVLGSGSKFFHRLPQKNAQVPAPGSSFYKKNLPAPSKKGPAPRSRFTDSGSLYFFTGFGYIFKGPTPATQRWFQLLEVFKH